MHAKKGGCMKKFLCFIAMFLFVANNAMAKEIDRKIIKNTTVAQVQPVILDTISLYNGVVTIKDIDEVNNKYVVDYNGTTFLGYIGWAKDKKYPKAMFSCHLKQKGNNVEITSRKVTYSGWFGPQMVFNHYKKIYNELKYQGFNIE